MMLLPTLKNATLINKQFSRLTTIEGCSINAGMYLYTLIADGKEVDTKKMILTK